MRSRSSLLQRRGLQLIVALCTAAAASNVLAQGTIKIGEINSYKSQPLFMEAYKKGMDLAVDEINAAGGVAGKKLEVITRDDNADPGEALRKADELLTREQVDILAGTMLSNVGVAVTDYAKQKQRFFLAAESLTDKITWQNGNPYTFRLRSSTYMLASAVVDEAVKMHKKRWALTYPNFEYGQAAAEVFKKLLKEKQPDVEFVAEQASPPGKIDAGSVVQALADAKPEALFNAQFGTDLAKLVREGQVRDLFKNLPTVSLLSGEPEYLDPLKDEVPVGWIVTGYPWYSIDTPAHKTFKAAYEAKYKEGLRLGSVVGYSVIKSLAAGIKASGGKTDTDSMVKAFTGLKVQLPDGEITYRAIDHQSTLGVYVGKLALKDGKGVMVDSHYIPGDKLLPSDDVVRTLRPAN